MNFTNGFTSWQETHFEVVSQITHYWRQDKCTSKRVSEAQESQGTGGLYELAKELTDKFETQNKDRKWDGEFFDEIESFLNTELKQYSSMKETKIQSNDSSIHLDCPNCDNWEQLGIDDPRKRLNVLPIVEWLPDEEDKNEFSIHKCTGCNTQFKTEWDYNNPIK